MGDGMEGGGEKGGEKWRRREKRRGERRQGRRRKEKDEEGDEEQVEIGLGSKYRRIVARANYLAQDRADIAYVVKEACRDMANPKANSWDKIKRVVRYLKGEPRVVYEYNWQNHEDMSVYVDTDWAGCFKTRKSTSG